MDKLRKADEPEVLAIDVPAAGRMAGMNAMQSYAAARRGAMPVIKLGDRRMKVPLKRWLAILNGEATA